jgi:hypothetical protein
LFNSYLNCQISFTNRYRSSFSSFFYTVNNCVISYFFFILSDMIFWLKINRIDWIEQEKKTECLAHLRKRLLTAVTFFSLATRAKDSDAS